MNIYVKKIINSVSTLTVSDINSYIAELDVSQNTKRMYIYWIKQYLASNSLVVDGLDNYEQTFHAGKDDLNYQEVQNVISNIHDNETKFIFRALLETGARLEEFLSVDWRNTTSCIISIKTSKAKNEYRNIFITAETLNVLADLLKSNYNFDILTRNRVQYLLRKLGECSNLEIALSPHVLRRTKGSLLRLNGASIEDIADILGHKSMDTTRKYYSKLNSQYLSSISKLSEFKPVDTIDINNLLHENRLLKKKITLLEAELLTLREKQER